MFRLKFDFKDKQLQSVIEALHKVPQTALRAIHLADVKWAESVKKIVANKFREFLKKDHSDIAVSTQAVLQAFTRGPAAEKIFATHRLNVQGPMDKWTVPVKAITDYLGTESEVHTEEQYRMDQKIPWFLRESFGPFTDAGGRPNTNTASGGGATRLKKFQRQALTSRFLKDAAGRPGEGRVDDDFQQALISALTSVPFVTVSKKDVEMVYLNPEQAMKVVEKLSRGKSTVQIEYHGKNVFRINAVRINGNWLLPLITRRKTPAELGVVKDYGTLDEYIQINPILDVYLRANDPIYINTALMRATDEGVRKGLGDLKHKIKAGTFADVKRMLRSYGAV